MSEQFFKAVPMLEFSKKKFDTQDFDGSKAANYKNIRFDRCSFQGLGLYCDRPSRRPRIQDVEMIGCDQLGCAMDGAIIEDVLIDDFNTHGQVLFFYACVFRHVVFKGNIGQIEIRNDPGPDVEEDMIGKNTVLQAFRDANSKYYGQVDWAIDISRGEFSDLGITGIPSRIIRRDPESQVVALREKLLLGEWKKLKFKSPKIRSFLQITLEDDCRDYLLIAPKRSKIFKDFVEDFKLLKKAGVVEPD